MDLHCGWFIGVEAEAVGGCLLWFVAMQLCCLG